MDSVGVVLVVLPDVGQHDVQTLAHVPLERVLPQDPVVQVVRVPQVLGVLEDASAVVVDLGLVDHVGDLRDVELVELSEWGEGVEGLVLVGGNLGVEDLDGLVGLPEIDLAVVAQVPVEQTLGSFTKFLRRS